MTSWSGRQGTFVDAASALHFRASNSRRTPVSRKAAETGVIVTQVPGKLKSDVSALSDREPGPME